MQLHSAAKKVGAVLLSAAMLSAMVLPVFAENETAPVSYYGQTLATNSRRFPTPPNPPSRPTALWITSATVR